jgi:UPF0176 protein
MQISSPPPTPADGAQQDSICVAAFYHFAALTDPASARQMLLPIVADLGIRGTILLAHEGINGTIAGSDGAVEQILDTLRGFPDCAGMDVKYSRAGTIPFARMKVRLKKEIVTLGVGEVDPVHNAGHYVAPQDWNALISDPDVVVVDTRNSYEVAIGTFAGAQDPGTRSFREFPAWFDAQAEIWKQEGRTPRIAMFCTGGIRCEKSTAFARSRGYDDVYHLQGGILRYLEEIPAQESLWEGGCFVFDERVGLGHGLAETGHHLCRSCGMPYRPDEGHACP